MGSKETVVIIPLGVDLGFRGDLFKYLEGEGHDVYIAGRSVDKVRDLINRERDLTVAIIDADVFSRSAEREVAMLIKERSEMKIIYLSSESQEWADINLDPSDPTFGIRDIEKAIREL